ncbi:MAG: hypothetical protein EB051_05900, partial [Chlamydiia bacterium]|nr:hypothetical protein [Chlamydiia bacterium]
MSIEGSESIFSNNFYNPVFLQKDSIRQALKKVSMVAGAVLLASALAPCLLASVPLLAKITIMKSAGALGCFILAKFIPRGRDHMALSQWVQSQPEDAKAEAQQILDILKKIDLSRPFELDLRNRTKITSLPNILQNCTNFSCEGCTSLETLPKLPVCRTLNCIGCTSLQVLPPALPRCERLNCDGCTSLRELPPELPACTWLSCRHCTSLQTLPELPVCEDFDCYN